MTRLRREAAALDRAAVALDAARRQVSMGLHETAFALVPYEDPARERREKAAAEKARLRREAALAKRQLTLF